MTSSFQIAVTLPVAEALVDAVDQDDADLVARLVADVAYPATLMVMLAAVVNPLLLLDADFQQVRFDHPACSYHAARYENGDRDLLAVHAYVYRQSIRPAALTAGTSPRKTTR